MALADKFASLAIFNVDPAEVDRNAGGRIGLFFPEWAQALAELISHDGQHTPIFVTRQGNRASLKWKLIAGLHRLEGCAIAGLECLAIELNADEAAVHLAQASENVDRRTLAPIERAMFVHAIAEAAKARVFAEQGVDNDKALAAKAKAARSGIDVMRQADAEASAASDNLSSAYGWSHETAEACGLGQRDVQRSLRIFRCIVADNRDLMDAFKDQPVAQNASDLLTICALKDPAKRRKVIEMLINGPKDLGMVLTMLGIKPPSATPDALSKISSQFKGAWGRLGTAEKRRFLPELVNAIPTGMLSVLRAEIDRVEAERGK